MKLNWRSALAFAHDITGCALAWLVAFWLRFNLEIPEYYAEIMLESLVWVLPLHVLAFWAFGLYRGIWRFASLPDLRRILLAVGVAAIAVPTVLFMMQIAVPRSVLIMNPVFLAMIMGGSRLAYRAWKERSLSGVISVQREPVFVLGSADAAINLIKDLARSSQWRVAGIFAEDATLVGRQLHGVNVLGRLDDVASWREKMNVLHGIIAMPEASHGARRQSLEICTRAGLQVLTVPSYDDLVSGRVTISQLRHVELDDLLGRDPVSLDAGRMREWLHGRPVLVTGAGGSIGAELCRQIARFEPSRLVLFELNEFALYNIEQEFTTHHSDLPLACTIGDIKDAARVAQVIQQYRPAVIFHAAAYKHVPLMESDNAWQAVLNNVTGTEVVARAAIAHGVEKFVLISTDKAVNPTSVMGATKRLAEMVCQALQPSLSAGDKEGSTRFVMVRFGNVLGSTGSVIPKFREQISVGGPITVTHPEVTRYFMSIPEAVQLVLQAGLMGKGGEIFVLDMGEPVKIADLARDLIKLSGYTDEDIRISYTGLRPGEKLYEEPLAADENTLPTPHPKLKIARARTEDRSWIDRLSTWLERREMPADSVVKRELAEWLPEYRNS